MSVIINDDFNNLKDLPAKCFEIVPRDSDVCVYLWVCIQLYTVQDWKYS